MYVNELPVEQVLPAGLFYGRFKRGELEFGEGGQDLAVIKIGEALCNPRAFPGEDRRFAGKKAFDALFTPGDTRQEWGRFA